MKKPYFDRICIIQLSDENTFLTSMITNYSCIKVFVFHDFEYVWNAPHTSSDIPFFCLLFRWGVVPRRMTFEHCRQCTNAQFYCDLNLKFLYIWLLLQMMKRPVCIQVKIYAPIITKLPVLHVCTTCSCCTSKLWHSRISDKKIRPEVQC